MRPGVTVVGFGSSMTRTTLRTGTNFPVDTRRTVQTDQSVRVAACPSVEKASHTNLHAPGMRTQALSARLLQTLHAGPTVTDRKRPF